jgi:hypothetical protein
MCRSRIPFLYGSLIVLTVGTYLPLWENGYVDYDDGPLITSNPNFSGGLTGKNVGWACENTLAPYRMPLTWLTLELDAEFFPQRTPTGRTIPSPVAVHGQNLVWHTASVLALFGLWRRLTGATWRPFFVAALFAVHPMHVESVAWAVERKDVLMGFFVIMTLWAYARYAERTTRGRYALVGAMFLLSLLAKPMLMTLPCVLLLLDYWPLRRLGERFAWRDVGRLALEKVPLFVAGMSVVIVETATRPGTTFGEVTTLDQFMVALAGYGWYTRTSFWPVDLAVFYPHPRTAWSVSAALVGAAILIGVTVSALRQARRRPWLAVGWLWFVGVLVPVIGFAQGGSQGWADRFSYWPHVGLFVAVSWGLGELVERLRVPRAVTAAGGILIVGALAAVSWVQITTWRDDMTVWQQAAAVTKDNDRAHEHLAIGYGKRGQTAEAEVHSLEAMRIQSQRLRN